MPGSLRDLQKQTKVTLIPGTSAQRILFGGDLSKNAEGSSSNPMLAVPVRLTNLPSSAVTSAQLNRPTVRLAGAQSLVYSTSAGGLLKPKSGAHSRQAGHLSQPKAALHSPIVSQISQTSMPIIVQVAPSQQPVTGSSAVSALPSSISVGQPGKQTPPSPHLLHSATNTKNPLASVSTVPVKILRPPVRGLRNVTKTKALDLITPFKIVRPTTSSSQKVNQSEASHSLEYVNTPKVTASSLQNVNKPKASNPIVYPAPSIENATNPVTSGSTVPIKIMMPTVSIGSSVSSAVPVSSETHIHKDSMKTYSRAVKNNHTAPVLDIIESVEASVSNNSLENAKRSPPSTSPGSDSMTTQDNSMKTYTGTSMKSETGLTVERAESPVTSVVPDSIEFQAPTSSMKTYSKKARKNRTAPFLENVKNSVSSAVSQGPAVVESTLQTPPISDTSKISLPSIGSQTTTLTAFDRFPIDDEDSMSLLCLDGAINPVPKIMRIDNE